MSEGKEKVLNITFKQVRCIQLCFIIMYRVMLPNVGRPTTDNSLKDNSLNYFVLELLIIYNAFESPCYGYYILADDGL